MFPLIRPRRLRKNKNMRRLVRDTHLSSDDFILPCFVKEGNNRKKEIASMPGVYQLSIKDLLKEAETACKLDIPAILLFGIALKKDPLGKGAYAKNGIIQKAAKAVKRRFPELLVITDACLCEYTSHGHCGVLEAADVNNDKTLNLLAKTSLSQAEAGADIIAPSSMMDGQVKTIRETLDKNDFSHIPIMAYSAKYSSSFYGPFRDAAHSAPRSGNRKTYQMDYTASREALKEIELDLNEGADIVMVKPALSYLDIIRLAKEKFNAPLAAYNVSGEYSMVKAAGSNGWINEKDAVLEILTSIKRAGASIIITYHAKEAVNWLK